MVKLVTRRISIPAALVWLPPRVANKKINPLVCLKMIKKLQGAKSFYEMLESQMHRGELNLRGKMRAMTKWASQSRKQSIMNCLLIETKGFIYRVEL